jgi:hypothetical protein
MQGESIDRWTEAITQWRVRFEGMYLTGTVRLEFVTPGGRHGDYRTIVLLLQARSTATQRLLAFIFAFFCAPQRFNYRSRLRAA